MNVKLKSLTMAATVAVAALSVAGVAHARDQIQVVGSSTVFPYSQAAAEQYANETGAAAPVVESTGTGGGMKIFCGGVGTGHPDVTGASRAMKKSEYELCASNGVTDITEVLLGYDGLSMAVSRSGKQLDLTKAQLFQALAAKVEVDGKIVDNPYEKWSEIDSSLPDTEITVMGPPPTSGTRDAWVELVMEEGCEEFAAIDALEKDAKKEVCQRMRTDGPFIEAGENDNLIVQRLESDPNAYGIFGYSFLYENQDKLQAVKIEGVLPEEHTIADGSYGISRPIFFYIKNAHRGVIPGLNEFIAEYTSDDAMGAGGYLSERGLIVLSDARRAEVQKTVKDGVNMPAPK
ncbi:substrate-binding domain-containing protein [Parvibaculum sp.]|jgi:phosphate transport system substrate-binding protein|uniref:substrate-binding domain-containing protein n=1 Tax=Parvibaculum sp. TaxID=2024848 RepID=UPI000C4BD24B|nr:substrate-binding domain-containing protein [Parvibaculum sp.]MAM95034.1 phosphate ABC transporter substrate-binding protein [Parvibaculum sp.]HCX67837.1 phosphate ABC transporter substrate-binding protein [Rhodobiaceae bacterium]|tara:strand:- start:2586 stop:3626 length:1041 start_codon:yes stop_codon:yes gene_type:complete